MTEPAATYTITVNNAAPQTAHSITLMTQRQVAALQQQVAGLAAEKHVLLAEIERRDDLLRDVKRRLARSRTVQPGPTIEVRYAQAIVTAENMIDAFMAEAA